MKPKRFVSAMLVGGLSCIFGMAFALKAQNPATPPSPLTPEGRLEAMRERLNLSEEQVEKLRPMVVEEAAKMNALKEDAALSDSQKKEQARALIGAFREKFGAVLSVEQKARLSEEMQRRALAGPPQDEVAQKLKAMKEKLGLSDEQVEKIRPVLIEEGPKLKALKEDKSISPEEKKETFKQSMERIAAILTPEQKEKMREQLQKRPN